MKHSWPLIHNHVPVFVYNGMIGSVLVLRCWFLILLSIEVQYTLIWAWLQPIVCTVTGPRTSLVFCLKKFFINLDMIVLHILPLSSTWEVLCSFCTVSLPILCDYLQFCTGLYGCVCFCAILCSFVQLIVVLCYFVWFWAIFQWKFKVVIETNRDRSWKIN